ncbi:unnamed protein product [Heligmosomoides polygyrus]|uniref:Small integral membrane protein 7 n=1 Tax=Heligmosomoides polygyrus TaxID=6339 RepID=A0A183F500_HELPZ|nr:unnamed protein product [Heligmosomoides polygyrus]
MGLVENLWGKFTGFPCLPEWDPPEPLDDEMFILLISLALLVITLFLPALILLLLGGYKRSHRQRTFEKHPTGDPTQMDHIFDRDGCYRQSRFEGMLVSTGFLTSLFM